VPSARNGGESLKSWFLQNYGDEMKNFPVHRGHLVAICTIVAGLDTVSRFQKAVDQMFTRVASDRPRVLIIDIRENGGGEDSAAQALLRHLTEKRFRLLTSVQIKRSKEAIVSTPRARSATGRASLAARACWSRQSIGTPGAWRTTRI
jgi:hypothetical protein